MNLQMMKSAFESWLSTKKSTNIELVVERSKSEEEKPGAAQGLAQLIQHVPDRPGHDFRYSLNCEKIDRLGWRPRVPFDEGLQKTIDWYKSNEP
jgi:dTDP-glucose 4,6-dehydratase